MEASASSLNGSGAEPSASDPFIAEKVRELEEFLAPLGARRAQLESEIRDIDWEQRRVMKAVAALQAEREDPKPKARPTGRGGRAKPGSGRDWAKNSVPAEGTRAVVLDVIRASDRPLCRAEVTDAVHANGHAITAGLVGTCLAWLRDHEQIRIARNESGKGGAGAFYSVMP